tara:strand:+ start:639 stop:812 length:174 start_codon:yes stop_codon:yes gene_type:complete
MPHPGFAERWAAWGIGDGSAVGRGWLASVCWPEVGRSLARSAVDNQLLLEQKVFGYN